jgi:hypothetical protein
LTVSIINRIIIILICSNFFYINEIVNYKVLFILGSCFLIRRIKIKWVITICCFVIIQLLLIWEGASNPADRVFVLITTILVGVGYLGWVSFLISSRAYNIPLLGYLIILIAGIIFRSNAVNVDPLVLVFIASISLHEKVSNKKVFLSHLILLSSGLIYSALISWRSAVLAFMIGFAYSIYGNYKLIPKTLLLVSFAVLGGFTLSYSQIILEFLIATGSGGDPSSGRFAIISNAFTVITKQFIDFDIRAYIGHGIGAFGEDFSRTMLKHLEVFRTEITSLYEAESETRLHAHNFIVQNLYEFGLIGLIIHAKLIFKMFNTLKRYRVFIYIGITSGLLSGTFYIYSEYFILLYALYIYRANKEVLRRI